VDGYTVVVNELSTQAAIKGSMALTQEIVDQGEEVELRIRSADTIHGFRIAGTGTNLVVPKRGKGQAVTTFNATTPGRYTIECNRMCGAGHNFMRAVLIVREPSKSGAR